MYSSVTLSVSNAPEHLRRDSHIVDSSFTLSHHYFLSLKCFLHSAANTCVTFRLDFTMEANTMNPDQTAHHHGSILMI